VDKGRGILVQFSETENVADHPYSRGVFMSEMLQLRPTVRKKPIELSHEERAQLNTIIDLLIPSDNDFPPPSSLHLVDELLHHLRSTGEYKATLTLSEHRLRGVLQELNIAAGGNFCQTSHEKQLTLLRLLEYQDLAFFQTLWTLVNHTYYKLLATR
jgi:hypothetical protein